MSPLKRPQTYSVLSKSYCLPFISIAKYARNLPFKISIWQTHAQEVVSTETKIKILVGCITALDERFDSKPSDIAEQRRRKDLIWYAIVPLLR